jgi:hypothetical protein
VLQLLKNNFGPGDKIVKTSSGSPYVYALGFIGHRDEHKLLLVNKRDRDIEVNLPEQAKAVQFVDQTTKDALRATQPAGGPNIQLHGYEVAVVTMR